MPRPARGQRALVIIPATGLTARPLVRTADPTERGLTVGSAVRTDRRPRAGRGIRPVPDLYRVAAAPRTRKSEENVTDGAHAPSGAGVKRRSPSAWSPRLQPWRAPRLKPWTPGRGDAVSECALT